MLENGQDFLDKIGIYIKLLLIFVEFIVYTALRTEIVYTTLERRQNRKLESKGNGSISLVVG